MSNHTASYYHDPDMAIPGHMSGLVYVHQTKMIGLHCGGEQEDGCGWFGGSFHPGRWREKHMREAWQRHVDLMTAGGVIEHGRASNVDKKVCQCGRCMIAWRQARTLTPQTEKAHA
jgi:hypothetical protein